MAMRFAKKWSIDSEIPTASMADIAFLLIIFFMITAVYAVTKGPVFNMPEKEEGQTETKEAVHIYIDANGYLVVDGKPMNLEDIPRYLEPKLTNNPNKPVIIDPHPDTHYENMVAVFDLLKQLKVKNISIPTQAEKELWQNLGVGTGAQ